MEFTETDLERQFFFARFRLDWLFSIFRCHGVLVAL